ncbi:DNA-binding MarR family transcriptional regulator [Methanomicrobium sp. W14]|uniref:winged helix-turn-helix transcriptional regulator n=1 Tax=Methanomicrobium sp. W14 TaxID=2817839 RepID=UPI001AE61597|nr:winged helix-turn-helix transcriptional regulator [Methanomicrobium sp. W14]MBP2133945.1 DNA-binding MarR family transcriptional regulator [Methanomicrobium sp. W14]
MFTEFKRGIPAIIVFAAGGVLYGAFVAGSFCHAVNLPESSNFLSNSAFESYLFYMAEAVSGIIPECARCCNCIHGSFFLGSDLLCNPALSSGFFFPFVVFPCLRVKNTGWKNIPDNDKRTDVYNYIKENPGIYFSEIYRVSGLNKGTVEYHLKVLESEGLINTLSANGRLHYFASNSSYSKDEKNLILILKNGILRSILEVIYRNPGINNKGIAEDLGYSESTVSRHLNCLKDCGIVRPHTSGWFVMYDIDDEYHERIKQFFYSESFSSLDNDKKLNY